MKARPPNTLAHGQCTTALASRLLYEPAQLLPETDRYRLFARLIYPRLVAARAQLESCYCPDNRRLAIEPVLLLGTSLLQFLEGAPDRAAVDLLRYHAGWNFALNRQLGDELFPPTSLVNFRQRLIDEGLDPLGFQTMLDGLVEAGLARPEFWPALWERYVENKLEYRAEASVLEQKMTQAGMEAAQLLQWLGPLSHQAPGQGEQVKLVQQVWTENFELDPSGQIQQRQAQPSGAVHNPHDPEAPHLQARRTEQRTEEFKRKARARNAIEGTQSELARGHGWRRARYRGLAKVRLQNYFIGAACNVKRWIRREVWQLCQAGSALRAEAATATAN